MSASVQAMAVITLVTSAAAWTEPAVRMRCALYLATMSSRRVLMLGAVPVTLAVLVRVLVTSAAVWTLCDWSAMCSLNPSTRYASRS